MTSKAADLGQRLSDFFVHPPEKLGVAVSGGSDSVALLCLLADWAARGHTALEAVTVDHGLRPEAAQEASDVARLCAELNIPHTVLQWQGWDGTGNLPDQARRARYKLMGDWADQRGIQTVALGHTSDDVAETFLMRLARGSGLDGLSSMSETLSPPDTNCTFVRPLLGATRAELRADLTRRGQAWAEDPTNEDDRFERARLRKALHVLEGLGIAPARLSETASRLREARDDLTLYVSDTATRLVHFDAGDVLISMQDAQAASLFQRPETCRRLLKAGVLWISGAEYSPRYDGLAQLIRAFETQTSTTAGGCRMVFHNGFMRLTREWKAVANLRVPTTEVWDARWQVSGPHSPDLSIAALGEAGLPHCPVRKTTGRPAASLIASPAVWRGSDLIAAPLAGLSNGWSAALIRDEGFYPLSL